MSVTLLYQRLACLINPRFSLSLTCNVAKITPSAYCHLNLTGMMRQQLCCDG